MKIIRVNAWGWRSPLDFYEALLAGLDAPDWHGRNVNALVDSIIIGQINGVEPPYRIEVVGLDGSTADARDELRYVFDVLGSEGAEVTLSSSNASLEITSQKLI